MGNVADGIVDLLRAWGTHRVFGYAGDGVDPLLAALARAEEDIEFVSPTSSSPGASGRNSKKEAEEEWRLTGMGIGLCSVRSRTFGVERR